MNSVLKKLSRALRHAFSTHYAFKRLAKYHSQPRSMEEVVDWAMNFGGGYMRIKTLQIPAEITRLAQAVKAIEPRIILETGAASGGTALIWSTLASERVITCDLHDIVEHQPLPTNQVFHLWKRLKTLASVEEFINDPKQCGFGIGLLHVPATGTAALPA